jgi:hypothetical protein
MKNGFKLSSSKSIGMHFCNNRAKLHYSPRQIVAKTKCLRLLFDSRFTFLPQIKMLKNKCHKALTILIFVSSTDWGANGTVLLN